MHAVLEEVKAYNKIIQDAEPIRDATLKSSVDLLIGARDNLLECFNNTPGNFKEIQRLLQVANTYALHVEVFMSYYDIDYREQQNRRKEAEILYKDFSTYLDDVLNDEKDNVKYMILFSYKDAAHKYFLNSLDFVFKLDDSLQKKVDTAKKYMEEIKNGYISKYVDDSASSN